jgi:hypothetical protein
MRRNFLVLSVAITSVAATLLLGAFARADQPSGAGAPVIVGNTTANPVPIRDAAAVADLVTLDLFDFCTTDGDTYTVPTGKVLVIEDLAGNLSVGAGERRQVGLLARDPGHTQSRFYPLPLTFARFEPVSTDIYNGHELMRVYVPSGWTIEALVGCLQEETGGGFGLRVNGHLVNVAG